MSAATAREASLPLTPTGFLASTLQLDEPFRAVLDGYEQRWRTWGQRVSDCVDRSGTPHVRMFDTLGRRVDEILLPPDYYTLLHDGYRAGIVWRAFEAESLVPSFLLGYVTSFFDVGLYCPYTVSLATAIPLSKYGDADVQARYLQALLRRDETVWQGATWMTEARGGSDLGASVETVARRAEGGRWLLTGDKYFCSNANAEMAVVAARPEGAPAGVGGLQLFLVPRDRRDGTRNFLLRRLKDKIATRSVPTGEIELRASEGFPLGGVHVILEVLNTSRVANAVGCAALTHRALADAVAFARERVAFGCAVADHPLLAAQIEERRQLHRDTWALACAAMRALDGVWRETPPYSDHHWTFRLLAHLAKYWTAEVAVQTAKWAMEVLGGAGTLAENRTERWLREAMICAIWEGTPHRQMLDALQTMERRQTHRLLLERFDGMVPARDVNEWRARLDAHLALPREEREGRLEPVFRDFARFVARACAASSASVRI
jgi:alkylation response protein AidB-like acyl-CoA dehydrogenase